MSTLHLPRLPLDAQAADLLRRRLEGGDFAGRMPAERRLAAELEISRPTLRKALAQLAGEGLLMQAPRRGWEIAPRVRAKPRPRQAVVRMLLDSAPVSALSQNLLAQEYLAEHLGRSGIAFHLETARNCFSRRPEKALEQLVRSQPADLWILCMTTRPIQEWFQQRQIRCLTFGSAHPSVRLPSIDEDYHATCRHAAGMLIARGHRHLAFLHSTLGRPGDENSLAGFQEAIAASRRPGLTCAIGRHNEGAESIRKVVHQLLRRTPRPTGWLVMNSMVYVTVFSQLAEKRLRIGREISVVCRNDDPHFEAFSPSVACYRRPLEKMHRTLLQLVKRSLRESPLHQEAPILISSRYCDGQSLGSPDA